MKSLISNFYKKEQSLDFKVAIIFFLLWNVFKLFQIEADPIIQILNALLSIGIYFEIEDKNLKIDIKKINLNFINIFLFLTVIIRSFYLDNVNDKYYYFLLPFGILALSFIGKPNVGMKSFKKIIIISLLLPIRRIFFFLVNPTLLFFTKYFTWFVLFCLGQEPNLIDRSIFVGESELIISKGCGGADNLYFAICALIIFKIIFSLKTILI